MIFGAHGLDVNDLSVHRAEMIEQAADTSYLAHGAHDPPPAYQQ
jgi:hypothetical protein